MHYCFYLGTVQKGKHVLKKNKYFVTFHHRNETEMKKLIRFKVSSMEAVRQKSDIFLLNKYMSAFTKCIH